MSWLPERVVAAGIGEAEEWFADVPASVVRVVAIVVVALVVWRIARRAIRSGADRARTALAEHADDTPDRRRGARIDAVSTMMQSIATWTVAGVAILLLLGEMGVNLGPLLAGAGVAGIAVAFGAQSLVRDLLAGFSVLMEDQYGVGDRIDAGPAIGVVERMTLRSTQIRDADGTIWHIPNGAIEWVGNLSQSESIARVEIGVAPEADLARARTIIAAEAAAMAQEDEWSSGTIVDVPQDLGASLVSSTGVTLRMEVRTRPDDQWRVERALRERLITALRREGVPLEVHHRTESGT